MNALSTSPSAIASLVRALVVVGCTGLGDAPCDRVLGDETDCTEPSAKHQADKSSHPSGKGKRKGKGADMRDLLSLLQKLKEAKTPEERERIRRELDQLSQAQARTLPGFEERDLLDRIDQAKSPQERELLITELEQMPVHSARFYDRWFRIHDIYGLEGWSDEGYDPSKSNVPRDLQLLAATDYGVSDIKNGGFKQFFWNDTGMFAPEMLEWFERAGLQEPANILRAAMEILGPEYPRSRELRMSFLKQHKLDPGSAPGTEPNPFQALDNRFFASLPWKQWKFEKAADRWIMDVCGIKSLRDLPTPNDR